MTRYLRLLAGLAVLAAIYWALDGFRGDTPTVSPEDAARPDSLASDLDVSAAAIGGPDDGPHFGYPPVGEDDALVSSALGAVDDWETITIGRNESFYVALQRNGLPHETIMDVVAACKPHVDLRKVRRGDTFLLARDEDGQLEALRFDVDAEHFVLMRPDASGQLQTEVMDYPVRRIVKAARGTIETSLFEALQENGANPAVADQLAEILGWNIDFFRDLRVGDEFVLLYAEYRHDDKSVRDPEILAAHFVNQGREYRAYRFENDLELPAYYDENGNSLERQFLRAPLKFSRISSGFSHRRLHPVLKRYRPHYGVDYAAPTGTPVFATAGGTIIERTRNKGSGNFVGIRHGNGYESYYLHLSKFAKGQRVGTKVAQGDVIGYVGATGWATAPHLDYRIKKNGKWVNPRKLSLPPAAPVSDDRRSDFAARVAELEAMIAEVPNSENTFVLRSTPANVREPIAGTR